MKESQILSILSRNVKSMTFEISKMVSKYRSLSKSVSQCQFKPKVKDPTPPPLPASYLHTIHNKIELVLPSLTVALLI